MKLYFRKSIGPYRKGQTKNVPDKLARFYVKNGIAEPVRRDNTYQTKVMVADTTSEPVDDLEGLDVEELRALAELRGLKVHHKAGAEKIKETLRSAEKPV